MCNYIDWNLQIHVRKKVRNYIIILFLPRISLLSEMISCWDIFYYVRKVFISFSIFFFSFQEWVLSNIRSLFSAYGSDVWHYWKYFFLILAGCKGSKWNCSGLNVSIIQLISFQMLPIFNKHRSDNRLTLDSGFYISIFFSQHLLVASS